MTVSTGTAGGTLGLNLTSATGITDIAGTALPTTGLPFVGQVYTLLTPPLYFSTSGNTNPPGVGGTSDDADIYFWNGSAFSRAVDVTTITNPLPTGANVDGLDRVDNPLLPVLHGAVTIALPGPDLTVQDEDVVFYNAGTWSVYFDGTGNWRRRARTSMKSTSSAGTSALYFSTDNTTHRVPAVPVTTPTSTRGTAPLLHPGCRCHGPPLVDANVDGLNGSTPPTSTCPSATDTTVPGLGAVQDEDVVYYNAGTWSVYFDGTGKGLTSGNLDVDAIDLP